MMRTFLFSTFAALTLTCALQAQFPSHGVTLLSQLTPAQLNASSGNDRWGYVSPSGREYAIMCTDNGTSFVEITDPMNPADLGFFDGPDSNRRDPKVFEGHAYAVSEGGQRIQVFDMSQIGAGLVVYEGDVTVGQHLEPDHQPLGCGRVRDGALIRFSRPGRSAGSRAGPRAPPAARPPARRVPAGGASPRRRGRVPRGSRRRSHAAPRPPLQRRHDVHRAAEKAHPSQSSGGSSTGNDCTGTFLFDMNARIQSGIDPELVPGAEVYAQFWSGDPARAGTTNLTDAVCFTICP